MRPICVPCHRFMHPKKTGFYFIEGMPDNGVEPGNAEPEKWKPYKLWVGDLWACEGCEQEIVVGVGREPISEHFKTEFKDLAQRLGAHYQVNDC